MILTLASQLREKIMGVDLMSASMLVGGTRIGDLIRQSGPWPRDQPLIQFARHFRNACAHGDRWNLAHMSLGTSCVPRSRGDA